MFSRRNFLQTGAMAAAGLLANAQVRADGTGIQTVESPLENADRDLWEKEGRHLRVGLVGSGWYGKSDLFRLIQCGGEHIEVCALCDVDSNTLEEAGRLIAERQANKKVPNLYKDYREMFANEKLDVCLIGTPDHWHALPAIAAMEAGCDVYLQKPIGVDVIECAAMYKTARRLNRVVQVGLQRRSTPILVDAKKKYFDSGAMGDIYSADTHCFLGWRGAPIYDQNQTPPPNWDFDFWCGPAPKGKFYRQFHRGWRQFMEYGNGIIGDMGVHMFDLTRWLMDLGWPKQITSNGGRFAFPEATTTIPDTQVARFDYDGKTVEWHYHTWTEVPDGRFYWGTEILGTKAQFRANSSCADFKPRGGEWVKVNSGTEFDRYPTDQTEPGLEKNIAGANRAHMWNFLARIVDRGRPASDIEEGYISTASCILANISLQMGGAALEWDPENICVKNNPEANKLLARPYRAPWKHPEI